MMETSSRSEREKKKKTKTAASHCVFVAKNQIKWEYDELLMGGAAVTNRTQCGPKMHHMHDHDELLPGPGQSHRTLLHSARHTQTIPFFLSLSLSSNSFCKIYDRSTTRRMKGKTTQKTIIDRMSIAAGMSFHHRHQHSIKYNYFLRPIIFVGIKIVILRSFAQVKLKQIICISFRCAGIVDNGGNIWMMKPKMKRTLHGMAWITVNN